MADDNGVMGAAHPHARIIVTDIQVWGNAFANGTVPLAGTLRDSSGMRWSLTLVANYFSGSTRASVPTAYHLTTPLVLPVGSDLWVDLTSSTSLLTAFVDVDVQLIGRFVTP